MARARLSVQQQRLLVEVRELVANGEARAIRERARFTIEDLSKASDVSVVTIRRWENGTVPYNTASALRYGKVLLRLRDELARSS